MATAQNYHLLVMRHAKSDWSSGEGTDFARTLAGRGIRDAQRTGKWLLDQGLVPDFVICSPAARAKETILLVAREMGMDPAGIHWEMELYEASLKELQAVISRLPDECRRVLLVGHNPGLDKLVEFLSTEQPDRTPAGKLMTTSAVAVLDFGAEPVGARPHSARLQILIRPREIA